MLYAKQKLLARAVFFTVVCLDPGIAFSQAAINRQALVRRHNVVVTRADSLSSLTVGNGRFAFTVDVTGLQTFPKEYAHGVSLGTESEWGWHSFIDTVGYKREEALKTYHLNGRDLTYSVQVKEPERARRAADWFRQNPHRLQLGNIGFELRKKDGSLAGLADIRNIRQELNLWTGEIHSHFTIEEEPVDVSTVCHGNDDAIAAKIQSPLLTEGRLKINVFFPYPTGAWADEGISTTNAHEHRTTITLSHSNGAVLTRQLDTTRYYVGFHWSGTAMITETAKHRFIVTPNWDSTTFSFTAKFNRAKDFRSLPEYAETATASQSSWRTFWQSGGAIDFSGSTDKRAVELERRIILSQYLMRVQEAGNYAPQETGLTYNSWFGKPHLEMTWWHAAHWALWGRIEYTEKLLDWYASVAGKAKAIAQRQGFAGVRWQKMTDNNGDEAPSSIGALLVWQQPHYIYFAEECYRHYKDAKTLKKYKDLVFATADFMASFAHYDSVAKRYILGKGLIPAQERYKAEETYNPPYELVYWKWALNVAQQWRERLHLPLNKKWAEVLQALSPLPVQKDKYLFAESAADSYTNPEYKTDHPSVLAAFGVMPQTGQVDKTTMQNTFDWIWQYWTWKDTWGWDFPMTAMTATRLGLPDKAIDALLMPIQTNTYLINGHNYQDERLRIYLPGNGGLLTAVAMMVAGYDGSQTGLPGIPKNGGWNVRWEGLEKMP